MQQRGDIIVHRAPVLHALAYAATNGVPVLVLVESANGGFSPDNAGARYEKVGGAENIARERLHRHCKPALGFYFQQNVGVLSLNIRVERVVRAHDPAVFRVRPRRDERGTSVVHTLALNCAFSSSSPNTLVITSVIAIAIAILRSHS